MKTGDVYRFLSSRKPVMAACFAATIHMVLIGYLLYSLKGKGSWGEVLPFAVDFPISIFFVWLVKAFPLSILHLTIGSTWWGFLAWAITKMVTSFVELRRRSNTL
jgi:hypothetical protein